MIDLSRVEPHDVLENFLGNNVTNIVRDKGETFRAEVYIPGNAVPERHLYNINGLCIDSEADVYYDSSIKISSFNKLMEIKAAAIRINEKCNYALKEKLSPTIDWESPEYTTILPKIRPLISWMAEKMEYKCLVNDYKGTHDGYSKEWLYERLLGELAELYNAMLRYDNEKDYEKIINECADLNNYSMFIADVVNKKYGGKL